MNKKQFDAWQKRYMEVLGLKNCIDNLQRLLEGVRRRSKSGCKEFRVSISRVRKDSYADHGVYVTIPEEVFRKSIVPAIKLSLEELKKKFKELDILM